MEAIKTQDEILSMTVIYKSQYWQWVTSGQHLDGHFYKCCNVFFHFNLWQDKFTNFQKSFLDGDIWTSFILKLWDQMSGLTVLNTVKAIGWSLFGSLFMYGVPRAVSLAVTSVFRALGTQSANAVLLNI